MAGTDRSRERPGSRASDPGPAIVLVAPQLGENIGAAARAMLNCGLTELRLVAPRDGWPNPQAEAMASGATAVIEGARVFDTTEAAVADLTGVYATTARSRYMIKPVVTPRQAAAEMRESVAAGGRPGILFGAERAGLDNDDVALADAILAVPLNPAFASLNLAQAVLLVAYEWFQAGDRTPGRRLVDAKSEPATMDDMLALFRHLEESLDEAGFFVVPEKRPSMVRSLRNLIHRVEPSQQEVRTLHGVISALADRRLDGRPKTGRKS